MEGPTTPRHRCVAIEAALPERRLRDRGWEGPPRVTLVGRLRADRRAPAPTPLAGSSSMEALCSRSRDLSALSAGAVCTRTTERQRVHRWSAAAAAAAAASRTSLTNRGKHGTELTTRACAAAGHGRTARRGSRPGPGAPSPAAVRDRPRRRQPSEITPCGYGCTAAPSSAPSETRTTTTRPDSVPKSIPTTYRSVVSAMAHSGPGSWNWSSWRKRSPDRAGVKMRITDGPRLAHRWYGIATSSTSRPDRSGSSPSVAQPIRDQAESSRAIAAHPYGDDRLTEQVARGTLRPAVGRRESRRG